jgi:hypothetical protein
LRSRREQPPQRKVSAIAAFRAFEPAEHGWCSSSIGTVPWARRAGLRAEHDDRARYGRRERDENDDHEYWSILELIGDPNQISASTSAMSTSSPALAGGKRA